MPIFEVHLKVVVIVFFLERLLVMDVDSRTRNGRSEPFEPVTAILCVRNSPSSLTPNTLTTPLIPSGRRGPLPGRYDIPDASHLTFGR